MLHDLLGIDEPVVLAPMGFVCGGALAAAVSRAGGLGLIGAGYGEPAWIRHQFQLAEGARGGVGFITWSLAKQPERGARLRHGVGGNHGASAAQ